MIKRLLTIMIVCICASTSLSAADSTLTGTESGTVTEQGPTNVTIDNYAVTSTGDVTVEATNSVKITSNGFSVASGGSFRIRIVDSVSPIATNGSFTVAEAANYTAGDLLPLVSDVDSPNTDLSFSIASGDQPSYGTVTFDPADNGQYSYQHDGSEELTDQFTYTVTDADGNTDTGVISITVTAVNDPPIANAGSDASGVINNQVTLDGSASSDPDSIEAYSWMQISGPTVTINNANTNISNFTPIQEGSYSFRLTVSDGENQATDDVAVTIVLNAVPVAVDAAIFTAIETTTSDFALSATDVEDTISNLDFKVVTFPGHGKIYNASNDVEITSANPDVEGNLIYFVPDVVSPSYSGIDEIKFTATDSQSAESNQARVRIHIGGTNTNPIAGDDIYEVYLSVTEPALNVDSQQGALRNDYDPDAAAIFASYVSGNGPNNGSLSFNSDGSFMYTPNAGFFGTDTFDYEIIDNYDASSKDQATVTITILEDDPSGTRGNSVLLNPSDDFQKTKWTNNTNGYQDWYVKGVDPARVWSLDPGSGNKLHFVAGSDVFQDVTSNATLEVIVKDASGAVLANPVPVNFTSMTDGVFTSNGLSAITKATDGSSKVSATYEPSKSGIKTIYVSSPMAGNILKFKVKK